MRRLALIIALIAAFIFILPGAVGAADTATSWGNFKEALEKASSLIKTNPEGAATEGAKARAIYDDQIAPAVTAAESAKARVLTGIVAAQEAAKQGDAVGLTVASELVEKSMLGLFLSSYESALKNDRVDDAKGWFDLLAAGLKFPESSDIYKEMKAVEADPKLAKTEGVEIGNDFVGKIIDKIGEELDEAIVLGNPKNKDRDPAEAQVKAAEGLGFFRAGEANISKKLGLEDTARLAGLIERVGTALGDGDWETAEEAADVAKDELAELETTKKLSGSAFIQQVSQVKVNLAAAARESGAGQADKAKKLTEEAWTDFTRVESQVRAVDAGTYVKIEKLFGQVKDSPNAGDINQLSALFGDIAAIKSGDKKATGASSTAVIFTTFERVQPILFALLALLGIYPIYLITRAFGWRNKAWRNIGIFIILLIVPVFMEALGRLGVEMKIEALQALSFTVSEWAKMAWALIVLAAFLFAISGLRAFCTQFGIKAFGVRAEEDEPISYDDHHAEVL